MKLRRLPAFVLLLLACGPEDMGTMPALAPPPWQEGETSTYIVTRGDSTLYRSRMTISLDEEYVAPPTGATEAVPPVPTLVVTNVVEPVEADAFFFDSVTAVLRRDDLSAIRSFRRLETDISELDVATRFEPRRAVVSKRTVDGEQEQRLGLPERSYPNDAIQTMLRALPLDPGSWFRMNLCVPVDVRTIPVKVTVLGTKLIKTGLGDILCREVLLAGSNREVRYWYELAPPRRFIGLEDRESGTEMKLAGYRVVADTLPAPAGADTAR